ncbi:MAG: MotA/TolQ/ExbB proton channel family protein [candidate division FCPU426 bacterium]
MTDIHWLMLLKSSPTLMVLGVCSLLSLVFIIERGIYYLINLNGSKKLAAGLQPMIEDLGVEAAIAHCRHQRGPMARVVGATLKHFRESRESLSSLLASLIKKEEVALERFLGILGTLGNTAPFIGLLGTVIGIIKAFQSLALAGSGGPNVVAAGIAEALVATAAGLVVAIPAVIFYNYYISRVRETVTDIEAAVEHILFVVKDK